MDSLRCKGKPSEQLTRDELVEAVIMILPAHRAGKLCPECHPRYGCTMNCGPSLGLDYRDPDHPKPINPDQPKPIKSKRKVRTFLRK